MEQKNSALIVVDMQNDFCPGGAMAVDGGDKIMEPVNRLQKAAGRDGTRLWKKVVATQDWHPENHVSFAARHEGAEPFQVIEVDGLSQNLWPVHCVAGSRGANFHPELELNEVELIVRKGTNPRLDSYSAFFENDGATPTGLYGYLEQFGIDEVYICGLAYDWCVYFSAVDAVGLGYTSFLVEDASMAVDTPDGFAQERRKEMERRGVRFTNYRDLLG